MSAAPLSLLDAATRAHEFPLVAEYTYLNTATQAPLPTRTCAALAAEAQRGQYPDIAAYRPKQPPSHLVRAQLGQLLNVAGEQFVFPPNTTYGLNICAHGIAWRPGDNVVLPANEFPSVLRTWLHLRRHGVEVRLVPWEGAGPRVDELMAAVDRHTRAVVCSAVAWDTGYRIDLEGLGRRCAAAGCLLIVDGIQLVGAAALDLAALQISALSFHGYKWLLAGFGCGALYISPDALEQITPRFVGEQSYLPGSAPEDEELAWQPGAERYSVGGANTLGLTALNASLTMIGELGAAAIAAHNRALSELLVAGLRRHERQIQLVTPVDSERRAAIVVFTLGDPARDAALVARLAERGIIVALRRRGVRVSPHLFNTGAEIERLLAALAECL